MSRRVPIRYRAEPGPGHTGAVVTASGEKIAQCYHHTDAVLIADALNRANGVGPAETFDTRIRRLEIWRRDIEDRLSTAEDYLAQDAEAAAAYIGDGDGDPIDRAIPPGAIFPRNEDDGA